MTTPSGSGRGNNNNNWDGDRPLPPRFNSHWEIFLDRMAGNERLWRNRQRLGCVDPNTHVTLLDSLASELGKAQGHLLERPSLSRRWSTTLTIEDPGNPQDAMPMPSSPTLVESSGSEEERFASRSARRWMPRVPPLSTVVELGSFRAVWAEFSMVRECPRVAAPPSTRTELGNSRAATATSMPSSLPHTTQSSSPPQRAFESSPSLPNPAHSPRFPIDDPLAVEQTAASPPSVETLGQSMETLSLERDGGGRQVEDLVIRVLGRREIVAFPSHGGVTIARMVD
ncbi:hypothetical protein K458DRAFT_390685 [Lentithecium fluviatile CBS 122367]|uniref:Uncharacterized protein n=1 Tax=Lentithecium fluviatile CBS 122367 TaxID=1168545 RepID=A0A6G1IY00_9PLEO|nr:hypothetical protein K458DRAFT_390685 [Lentithecium fluviatile CBS 122367]